MPQKVSKFKISQKIPKDIKTDVYFEKDTLYTKILFTAQLQIAYLTSIHYIVSSKSYNIELLDDL